ncbi:MAG: hypothetical protein R3F23_02480 [Verrucomicrobiia bacterium]
MNTLTFSTLFYVAGFIAAQVGSMICFKYVSENSGKAALKLFLLGNTIGFFCTIFLPLALKNQNPNLIYALCLGGGFCLLQLSSYYFFSVPLSNPQWLGIFCVGLGMILLQIK